MDQERTEGAVADMTRPATGLAIVLLACLALAHSVAKSRALWLGLGFPLMAIGLSVSGLSPASALESLGRWALSAAIDCRITWAMLREVASGWREEHRRRREGA